MIWPTAPGVDLYSTPNTEEASLLSTALNLKLPSSSKCSMLPVSRLSSLKPGGVAFPIGKSDAPSSVVVPYSSTSAAMVTLDFGLASPAAPSISVILSEIVGRHFVVGEVGTSVTNSRPSP